MPKVDSHYDLAARNYRVQRNGRRSRFNTISGYDTANFYPVVVDYRDRQFWAQYQNHHAWPATGAPSRALVAMTTAATAVAGAKASPLYLPA